jgi:hypothetical protein
MQKQPNSLKNTSNKSFFTIFTNKGNIYSKTKSVLNDFKNNKRYTIDKI